MTLQSLQEVESLIINAENGEVFAGLTYRQANAFQRIAFYRLNGYGVVIHCDHHSTKPTRYAAEVRFIY